MVSLLYCAWGCQSDPLRPASLRPIPVTTASEGRPRTSHTDTQGAAPEPPNPDIRHTPRASLRQANKPLTGKVALVSGASGGLGYAAAASLAEAGANVAITELPERIGDAEAAAVKLHELGGTVEVLALDVREATGIQDCVAECVRRLNGLDILVNNAGVIIRKPALEVTPEEWDAVVDVDLRGVFFLAQAAGRHMAAQRTGKIINLASIFGLVGGVDRIAYSVSKAGVVNMTRSLGLEWAPYNIQVNAVAPAFARTPLTEQSLLANPGALDDLLARTPNRRLVRPEEVGSAIAFLASPAADAITGVTLPIDGGWTAQ